MNAFDIINALIVLAGWGIFALIAGYILYLVAATISNIGSEQAPPLPPGKYYRDGDL